MLKRLFCRQASKNLPVPEEKPETLAVPGMTARLKNYAAAPYLTRFRSAAFYLPGSVRTNHEEHWEAVLAGASSWTVQRVSSYDGLAGQAAAAVTVKTLYEGLCFYEALYRVAEYEATQGDLHRLDGVVKRDDEAIGAPHFREAAHRSGFVLDTRGYPHPLENGRPARDATVAKCELTAVADARKTMQGGNFLQGLFPGLSPDGADAVDPRVVRAIASARSYAASLARSVTEISRAFHDAPGSEDALQKTHALCEKLAPIEWHYFRSPDFRDLCPGIPMWQVIDDVVFASSTLRVMLTVHHEKELEFYILKNWQSDAQDASSVPDKSIIPALMARVTAPMDVKDLDRAIGEIENFVRERCAEICQHADGLLAVMEKNIEGPRAVPAPGSGQDDDPDPPPVLTVCKC